MVEQFLPKFLFLETTWECNLRCRQCHLWMTKDPNNALSTNQRIKVVQEFAEISKRGGNLIITGAEPLRRLDEVYALAGAAKKSGIFSTVVTNGTMIEMDQVKEFVENGPDSVCLSLDGRAEIHDWIRGKTGVHDRVLELARSLVKFGGGGVDFLMFLCERTFDEVEYVLDVAERLGVRGVFFQPLLPTLANRGATDVFFQDWFPTTFERADRVLDFLKNAAAAGSLVRNRPEEFDWMKEYFRSPFKTASPVCDAGNRNVIVSLMGEVKHCFFMMEHVTKGVPLGNIKDAPLSNILSSHFAAETRAKMEECRAGCGMMGCNRKGVLSKAT